MDSLLYVGAGDDDSDDDDDDDEDEDEVEQKKPKTEVASFDYTALERAGYKTTGDLRQTETYQKLTAAEETEREEKQAAKEREAAAAAAAKAAKEEKEAELLNQKKLDEKMGWEKRYDRTKEDFRNKEKRKRSQGQQSHGTDWVQEEKRRLRHGDTGSGMASSNYDS